MPRSPRDDCFLVTPGHERPTEEHVVADESAYKVVALHPHPSAHDDVLPEAL